MVYFFSEQVDEDDCKELFGREQGYKTKHKLIDKIKEEICYNEFKSIESYDKKNIIKQKKIYYFY